MGKLSWNDLRLIYEGQYGVEADEASKWIAKELKIGLVLLKKLGVCGKILKFVSPTLNS
jgi:hypothetical protein